MASDDNDTDGVLPAVPREGFVAAVKRVLPTLMPAAGAVTNLTAGIFEGAQFEAKLKYGDASDTVPTHFTLPLTIATLAQFGRHAILYRFHDEASDAITLSVLFEEDAAETVLEFVDRCVDASEEIVGTVIYEVEE